MGRFKRWLFLNLPYWMTWDWWDYCLTGRATKWCKRRRPTWRAFWCRWRGHPAGPVWFADATALEPDMRCQNCGDVLG